MATERIGVWLIGAWGGVATTTAVGLAALQKGVAAETALVTALPRFEKLDPVDWDRLVVGGHEIRETGFAAEARRLHEESKLFDAQTLTAIEPTLAEWDANIRNGTLINVGETIGGLASAEVAKTTGERPADAVDRLSADLQAFRRDGDLQHVIVVNLASTEPPLETDARRLNWRELSQRLGNETQLALSASSVYAIAAMQSGCSYVNFTPSVGSDIPALYELAEQQGVLHVGRDGKTGETLLKSVLAPMFAARNLAVRSWVGHNIFGNLDGKVLDDPVNKANKVRSKDHLLTEILRYKPQTLVSIEYIESMGDWKTAWDHVHFAGFLNTPMTLQFIWQGCDSVLAAPLVLDLIRFTEREQRRGGSGVMPHLSSFFKSPMGTDLPEFHKQYDLLEAWADEVAAEVER